jgi:hypothetical protein
MMVVLLSVNVVFVSGEGRAEWSRSTTAGGGLDACYDEPAVLGSVLGSAFGSVGIHASLIPGNGEGR